MITTEQLKNIENQINELLDSAKNVVKMRKALKIAKEALKKQKEFISTLTTNEQWIELNEQLGDCDLVYDIEYDLEQLIKKINYSIDTRHWTGQNYAFASLCAQNID